MGRRSGSVSVDTRPRTAVLPDPGAAVTARSGRAGSGSASQRVMSPRAATRPANHHPSPPLARTSQLARNSPSRRRTSVSHATACWIARSTPDERLLRRGLGRNGGTSPVRPAIAEPIVWKRGRAGLAFIALTTVSSGRVDGARPAVETSTTASPRSWGKAPTPACSTGWAEVMTTSPVPSSPVQCRVILVSAAAVSSLPPWPE